MGGSSPAIAFLFTGQGSQYVGMGQQLYQTQPTFKATVDHCSDLLQVYLGWDIKEVIFGKEEIDYPPNPPLVRGEGNREQEKILII